LHEPEAVAVTGEEERVSVDQQRRDEGGDELRACPVNFGCGEDGRRFDVFAVAFHMNG
jgi:hypothetical protein